MSWQVEHVPHLDGYTVEWSEPGRYYLSRRNRIFHSQDLKPPFTEIARVDAPLWKSLAAQLRLGQRLFRFMAYNVMPLKNGDVFVTFAKSVGVIRDGKYTTLPGLRRPCRALRSGCAVDAAGDVFFGEYLANDERGEMVVYRFPSGANRLEIAHTFPPGSIKHVHGLYFDEFSDAIFCLTGDKDDECRISRTSDGFKTVEIVGSGDETWRAVSILFNAENFYYGTDAEFRTNEIFRVNRQTLDRQSLADVDGTVFYSKRVGEDMFFTTTAENAPSQKENVAAIWHIDAAGKAGRVAAFPKDRWHGSLFMFGTIHFPIFNGKKDELYFSLVGVRGDDKAYRLIKNV